MGYYHRAHGEHGAADKSLPDFLRALRALRVQNHGVPAEKITSLQNPRLKRLVRLRERREREGLTEGAAEVEIYRSITD